MRRARRLAASAALLITLAALTSCTTNLDAEQMKVQISPADALVATPSHVQTGEVVITVDNQSFSDHTLDLARLNGAQTLPVVAGRVPDGTETDLTYEGDGYTIVAKLDPIDKFSYSRDAPTEVLHQFLASGTYVLFDIGQGNLAKGMLVRIAVA